MIVGDILSRQNALTVKYEVEKGMWYGASQDEDRKQQRSNNHGEAI